jgi:hypothetical protein
LTGLKCDRKKLCFVLLMKFSFYCDEWNHVERSIG